jgi:hypothetical protein
MAQGAPSAGRLAPPLHGSRIRREPPMSNPAILLLRASRALDVLLAAIVVVAFS